MSKVPVLFLTFNRLEETKKSFEKIAIYKPDVLYIASDGWRVSKFNEDNIVKNIRNYLLSKIDWPCKVYTRFNEQNLGCKLSVSSSISWFFENEEFGVIIEDDCLVDISFFDFCNEIDKKYRNLENIWHIDGSNFVTQDSESSSFHFSKYFLIWGWATWKRSWEHYTINMDDYNNFKSNKTIKTIFQIKREQKYWMKQLDLAYDNKIDTWDYQWFYTIWKNNGMSIRPNVNLVLNIGFSNDATHTKQTNSLFKNLKLGKINFPLDFNIQIKQDIELDQLCSAIRFSIQPFVLKIIKKMFKN